MPTPIARLRLELSQLRSCLTAQDYRRYLVQLALNGRSLVAQKTLAPVDHAMRGRVPFALAGGSVVVPLDEMAAHLKAHDPTPTFGGAREMYASNVYLRAFRPGLKARTVVDLGSNRGLFVALAARVLGAGRGVSVEPQEFYLPAYRALLQENGLDPDNFPRVHRFASASAGPQTATLAGIMQEHSLSEIDFLKCDIEGGEFDVFLANNDFLDVVKNLAMELHPEEGSVADLARTLREHAFDVRISDQFGAEISPEKGHYLHASRDGSLVEARP
jgi:SAM-dependent methyltransferase